MRSRVGKQTFCSSKNIFAMTTIRHNILKSKHKGLKKILNAKYTSQTHHFMLICVPSHIPLHSTSTTFLAWSITIQSTNMQLLVKGSLYLCKTIDPIVRISFYGKLVKLKSKHEKTYRKGLLIGRRLLTFKKKV
jgi:hypothetical protein